MSISQNFPNTRPSLNLNFARSQILDPRITFTRTTSGTRVGPDGYIEVIPADQPRFDFDPVTGECLGLLIEEQRTNLWNNSNDFTVWTKQTSGAGSVGIAVTNATVSPDGTSNAYRYFAQESGSTFYSIYRGVAGISSNTTYTYSAFMKAGEISTPSLVVFDNTPGSASFVNFNLSNGTINSIFSNATTTISSASSITNYGNGWYRCSAVWSSTVSGNGFQFKIDLGGALSQNQGMFVYGAQLEQGSFPTSYIPTQASTVTRTIDNASITGTNFSGFYNPSEGTFVSKARSYNFTQSTYPYFLTVTDGTNNNRIDFGYLVSSLGGVFVRHNNVTQVEMYPSVNTNPRTGSLAYKLNDVASCYNAGTVFTDTTVTIPTVNGMQIGDYRGSLNTLYNLNGYISQITYYPVRLSNSQLQTLTK